MESNSNFLFHATEHIQVTVSKELRPAMKGYLFGVFEMSHLRIEVRVWYILLISLRGLL